MAGPEFDAATVPVITKMPAPMMTPTPKTIRSRTPRFFFSWCSGSSVSAMDCSTDLVRNRLMPSNLFRPARPATRAPAHPTLVRRRPDRRSAGSACRPCAPARRARAAGPSASTSSGSRRTAHRLEQEPQHRPRRRSRRRTRTPTRRCRSWPRTAAPLNVVVGRQLGETVLGRRQRRPGQHPVLGGERPHRDVLGDALAQPGRYAVGAARRRATWVSSWRISRPRAGPFASSIRGLSRNRVSAVSVPVRAGGHRERDGVEGQRVAARHVLQPGQEGRGRTARRRPPGLPVVGHPGRRPRRSRSRRRRPRRRRTARCRRRRSPSTPLP